MYYLYVRRGDEWHLVGQYRSKLDARVIARDYKNRGERTQIRKES